MTRIGTKTQHLEPKLPAHIRLMGIAFRTVLIVLVLIMTVRVSSPQVETIWSAYETPSELVRMALGLAVAAWLVVQIFRLPKDAEAYQNWIYLGLVLIPLGLLCAYVIW
jgi:hypothetical protein